VQIDHRVAALVIAVAAFSGGWVTKGRLAPTAEPATGPAPASRVLAAEPSVAASPAVTATATATATAPLASASSAAALANDPMAHAFEDIYKNATWSKKGADGGTSGFGSTLHATAIYRAFLAQFMKDADVHSVVDAGCGDWEFSQAIDWKGIDYKGFDIVKSVIDADTKAFARPGIQFFAANIVETELPPADLLIVKHVLQHLPTAAVHRFLRQLPKYKHVLIMSSVNDRTLTGKNDDIEPGGFRTLDITRAPFNVPAAKMLTYWDGGNMQQVVHVAPAP
jgi:2-polyprenyl-3-methyl-5-hydroxy-6-metoxy-1,4-benzoquinol methylase